MSSFPLPNNCFYPTAASADQPSRFVADSGNAAQLPESPYHGPLEPIGHHLKVENTKRQSRPGPTRPNLAIGIYSPSDSKHVFRDFRPEDDYPYLASEDLDQDFAAYKLRQTRRSESDDPFHGWANGRQAAPTHAAKRRLLGTPLALDFRDFVGGHRRFPEVRIVTGLLIRRQYYRHMDPSIFQALHRESYPP